MVARRRIRSTKDTPRHAGRLFRWQRRRRSTEDAPREENEDLTESPRTTHWLDGKEDEAAQKTSHARRTKISQETNLSMGMRSSLNKGKTGHYSRPDRRHSNREHHDEHRETIADILGRQTWPKTLPRKSWSWTYTEHRGPGHIEMIQEHHREMIQGDRKDTTTVLRGKHEKGTVTRERRGPSPTTMADLAEGTATKVAAGEVHGCSCYYHSFH